MSNTTSGELEDGSRQSSGRSSQFLGRLREFTPLVAFGTFYTSIAMFNYGYDVGVFSGLQAMEPFERRFGTCTAQGKCSLPSYLSSIMNSTPFLGKLIGCWVAVPIAERLGRKKAMLVIALVSLVAVALQISATTAAQFTIGRILAFGMTGICVLSIPAYMAEIAPPSLRGFISSQLQIQIVFSQLIASGINYGTAEIPNNNSWRIPVLIQFVMPVFLLALLPVLVESPRWLISRGRREDALQALQKLRKKNTPIEAIRLEIDMLASFKENEEKGTWPEIFRGTNKRRTFIVIIAMIGQQITGQSFTSQYSTIFYKQQGFTNAFELSLIATAVTLAGVLLSGSVVDSLGRRPLLIGGGLLQALWLYLVGGIGTVAHPSQAQKNTLVAALMLFGISYGLSWASLSYIILSEAASRRVVEKTNMLAISLSVVTAFVVSFTVPYLVNADYGNLGAKVGFLYGSLAVAMTGLAWLFVPEMKGLSLEQLDRLFESGTPTRGFGKARVQEVEGAELKVGVKRVE